MSDATILANALLVPEVNDSPSGYLESLIIQAKQTIIAFTRHTAWPGDSSGETVADEDAIMEAACVRLVVAMYRRSTVENADTYKIGDLSVTNWEHFPPEVKTMLKGKRRAQWSSS